MNVKKTIMMSLAVTMTGTMLLYANGGVSVANAQTNKAAHVASFNEADAAQKKKVITQALDEVVAKGIPGVIVQTLKNGAKWEYATGKASIYADRSMQPDFHFRIGSITKTFVATVVLQLAGEGKLSLDDTVEKWLPGVVQGNGHDGSQITVRQLLNMTSGIADCVNESLMKTLNENRFKTYTAEELVKIGLQQKPLFTPGTKFDYSSTNTVLAGLIVQKVTGQSYAEQIKQRIIEPLQLKNTSVPGSITKLPEPHARGYSIKAPAGALEDFTEMSPTWGNAAGEMISTTGDLNRFFSELLAGKLLKPEQMKEMLNAVPSPEINGSYGLGINVRTLANGVSIWGHAGGVPGFISYVGGTLDGKHVISFNYNLHHRGERNKAKVMKDAEKKMLEAEFGNPLSE
ncbi:serine hydrolase domain-containing protein [Paenibacillus sp. 481]|uniref:serine hydrolase domain-containing protein n=1 Tax=Paenibacillus sp. 481 TaxID=2835869 RepID=UPI001E585EB0|nr:serine hydrolase domain-containing protein [Paenibacillus sp. 481]UHA75540.1 beta-lactamase family protein [Paenibacillus sp. 481]